MGVLSSGGKKADLTQVLADLVEVVASLQVLETNGDENAIVNQLIGGQDDDHNARTIFANVDDLWFDKHSGINVYPTLADSVTVTSNAAAWTLGGFAEVVPINTITAEFHIHRVAVSAASANGEYELVLYNGTTEIGRVSFSRTDKKDDIEGLIFSTEHIAADSQIQAKLAFSGGGGAKTAKVKIWYHDHGHT